MYIYFFFPRFQIRIPKAFFDSRPVPLTRGRVGLTFFYDIFSTGYSDAAFLAFRCTLYKIYTLCCKNGVSATHCVGGGVWPAEKSKSVGRREGNGRARFCTAA